MITQELRDYVARCKQIGWSDEDIKTSLASNNWQPEDIAAVLTGTAPGGGSVPQPLSLEPVSYEKNLGSFLLLTLGYVIPAVLLQISNKYLMKSSWGAVNPLIMGGYIVLVLGAIFVELWFALSLVFFIVNLSEGVSVAMHKALHRIFSYLWIAILLVLIVWFGYLLVFIPAIVFGVWFSFAVFVLAQEDARGLNALLKSKEYVRGHWWLVFWRIVALILGALVILGIYIAISFGFHAAIASIVASAIFGILMLFYYPFAMVVMYNLFIRIKNQKGVIPLPAKGRTMFTTFAVLGLIVPIGIIALVVVNRHYHPVKNDCTSYTDGCQQTQSPPYPYSGSNPGENQNSPIIQQQ